MASEFKQEMRRFYDIRAAHMPLAYSLASADFLGKLLAIQLTHNKFINVSQTGMLSQKIISSVTNIKQTHQILIVIAQIPVHCIVTLSKITVISR